MKLLKEKNNVSLLNDEDTGLMKVIRGIIRVVFVQRSNFSSSVISAKATNFL